MVQHPGRHKLMAYAESLVDKRAAIPSSKVASHVGKCQACAAEVKAIRQSLAFAAQAPALKPTQEFDANLRLNVRQAIQGRTKHESRRRVVVGLAKGLSWAAGIAVVATLSFSAALRHGPGSGEFQPMAPLPEQAATASASNDSLGKATAEIVALAAAVGYPSGVSVTFREREQRRRVLAVEAELAEATAALQENPGCTRASLLIKNNIERQAQMLRTLYLERSL